MKFISRYKHLLAFVFIVAVASVTYFTAYSYASKRVQCNVNDIYAYNGSQVCVASHTVFPSGTLLPFTNIGSCPSGFSEATDLDDRFLLGTTFANADINTTGGSNSITPSGSISPINFTTITNVSLLGLLGDAALRTPTSVTPTFTGNAFDPTPQYKKVVWCRRN